MKELIKEKNWVDATDINTEEKVLKQVLSQKINICVKINCNLFLCNQWIKHHPGEKLSHPLLKLR
ncbi:hypothetical protein [Bathymodiolus platifrons methanotrophic gill symbiont]|uniref:hypothetical protein n=1 Tax=Bathymodiolus platifrons methanotrophic gill symbiont TaxID=113268 RepID=UPI000B4084EE|nr:hypothetical protein [Bathymodiolus platifrons methanotrophic gill symbiont]